MNASTESNLINPRRVTTSGLDTESSESLVGMYLCVEFR